MRTPSVMPRTCAACGAVNRIPIAQLAGSMRCNRCGVPLPPSARPIDIVDPSTFDEILIETRVPVLVDFWALWSTPCRAVAFEVERTATTTSGRAIVLRVNIETLPQLAVRYRVQGIPNFVVFEGGTPVRQRTGVASHADLLRLIEPS